VVLWGRHFVFGLSCSVVSWGKYLACPPVPWCHGGGILFLACPSVLWCHGGGILFLAWPLVPEVCIHNSSYILAGNS
jgi:hypothetical protein